MATTHERPVWQLKLAWFFRRLEVEIVVATLVMISVLLTLSELTWGNEDVGSSGALKQIVLWNDVITYLFVVELVLRYMAASSKRRYFREYWLDIIAVLPVFQAFRSVAAVRLLRLVRLLRMFSVASRLASQFPYILRRGAREFFFTMGVLVTTIVFATGAMLLFNDLPPREGETLLYRSFWFSVYSLFAGEPIPDLPRTLGGRIVSVFVMFMGLTVFAMFTGTVSAFMVERLRMEKRTVDWDELRDHVIVCGWNSKAEIILQEYRAAASTSHVPIVVIASFDRGVPVLPAEIGRNVFFLDDDFTRIPALEQAGIHRARTCIVLADRSSGRGEQDVDARTILAALTVEKLNPAVYTCAELLNASYGSHLQMGHVNDYVVSGEYAAFLLAQAAMNRGLMNVFNELMTVRRGNEFYRVALPDSWAGTRFIDAMLILKSRYQAILVAVQPHDGEMLINPTDYVFRPGDEVVVIAADEIRVDSDPGPPSRGNEHS